MDFNFNSSILKKDHSLECLLFPHYLQCIFLIIFNKAAHFCLLEDQDVPLIHMQYGRIIFYMRLTKKQLVLWLIVWVDWLSSCLWRLVCQSGVQHLTCRTLQSFYNGLISLSGTECGNMGELSGKVQVLMLVYMSVRDFTYIVA